MPSRIEDYALIGDGRTAALVSRRGSIDWLCLPRFDSDACCSALLGTPEHGHWLIGPCADTTSRRRYDGDTLVLQTEFTDGGNAARLTDFMAIGPEHPVLVRQLTGLQGMMRFRCRLALRFDFGLLPPRQAWNDGTLVAMVGPDLLALRSSVALKQTDGDEAVAEFDVAAGQTLSFVLSYGASHQPPPGPTDPDKALSKTLEFWSNWAARFQRPTVWRDAVVRSLLTLKALTYHPTGGIVAAPTTSLPEKPGGQLNWDYRYCWLRDASFTLSALLNAGYSQEAVEWRDWMLRAVATSPEKMRIMYRVDGSRRLNEWVVKWLPGYQGAHPVHVGNSAADQQQTDVVGELLDALDLIARAGIEQTPETISSEQHLVEHLEKHWQDQGHGLWESRGQPERYTYSVVMSWVGVDRFVRGCERRGCTDDRMLDHLRSLRARIRQDILENFWHRQRGHFVDRYGGARLDASLLLLPLVNFLPATDPRMSATIDAVARELSEDGLVWRTPHGGDADQGAFIACSCWLADCRALQGRRDEAVALLEKVLSLRNDIGLLSEEYHPGLGQLIGNFPQALSHLALVNTALGLSGPVLQRGGG